uniref:EF-hand domain-containing protein n=1 Tax=Globisporangium ultimum (strain ATCC 200006 / CBS 805.95 / DAOM BR144) TaxID=431595 RepID=K3WWE7_GLOUD
MSALLLHLFASRRFWLQSETLPRQLPAERKTPNSTSSLGHRRQALRSPIAAVLAQNNYASFHSKPSLHSPRVLFLSSCIAQSQPAISILLRKENCHTYDFSHQGLGDKFIIQFAACLPDLPLVEAINVCGNRLSDNALNCLLLALENKPNLVKLDISENEVGAKSAKSLRDYIASSLCTIKTLGLNNADVDDQECTLFMIAFEKNKSVEQLYLRSNRVGQVMSTIKAKDKSALAGEFGGSGSSSSESGSTGSSPLPTGGEAIGAMLNVNLNIAHIDLSWNLIKFESASQIGNALQLNYNLKELNLSYNACGDQGAMVFGHTIRVNTVLTKLNLSYNNIGAKGAMVIASGLAANKGLRELVLDGNSIGLESGRALMHAACTRPGAASTICHVSLFNCNLTKSVGSTTKSHGKPSDAGKAATKEMMLFNPADPMGKYSLELSDPYENMIAHELLRIATFKEGYRFVRLEHSTESSTSGGSKVPQSTKIELSRRPQKAVVQHRPDTDAETLVSAFGFHNRSPIALLFAQIDKDRSGSVDFDELTQALRGYGLSISEDRLAALLSEYDYDHNGSLQEDEFQDFFLRCGFAMVDTDHSGSLNREEIKNVIRYMGIEDVSAHTVQRMVAQYDMNNSGEIDEHEFVEFMKVEMFRTAQAPPDERETLDDAYEAVVLREPSGAVWKIPTSGTLEIELDRSYDHHDTDEARRSSSGGNVHNNRRRSTAIVAPGATSISGAVVSKLVASVQGMSRNAAEQADFLKAVLADSDLFFTAAQAEELLLKQGDLKNTNRKLAALVRLLPQIVNRREAITLVVHLFDTKTQWTERLALRKKLGTNMYSVLLGSLTSKYCFDLALPNDRAALKKFALIAQKEKQFSKNRSGRQDTSQHGNWENFRHATIDGKPVLLTSTYILNALLAPTATSFQSAIPRDDQKRKVEFFYISTTRPPRGTKNLTKRRFDQLAEILMVPVSETVTTVASNSHHSHARRSEPLNEGDLDDAVEKNRQNVQLRWEILRNSVLSEKSKTKLGEALRVQSSTFFRVQSTLDAVQQKLTQLEMLVSDRWLSCDQAAELIAAFPNAINARAKAACILFGRLVDVGNFIKIYDELSREDQRECIHRLGWLNIFDPMQPDRQYPPLDLSIRDERELVQILAQLALNEG